MGNFRSRNVSKRYYFQWIQLLHALLKLWKEKVKQFLITTVILIIMVGCKPTHPLKSSLLISTKNVL